MSAVTRMLKLFGVFVLAAALGAGIARVPAALAQDKPAKNLNDQDLRRFAKAYVEFKKIQADYEVRIKGTQDAKERERLQKEGDAKVNQALQKQGFSPDSYTKTFATVNDSEPLRKKTLKYVEEERKK
jgi:hypothetical protein